MPDALDGDFIRSRAVLVGTWDYRHLRDVPAAKHSLERMRRLLTSPICGPWPMDQITLIDNPRSIGDLPHRLVTDFAEAEDVALFYYVGHGQYDLQDRLCLALGDSETKAPLRTTTSLTFDSVRHAFHVSNAATKIAILDCCFAEIAIMDNGRLAGPDRPLPPSGSYLMMASGAYATAWYQTAADHLRPQTYFTKYLADTVENGIPGQPAALTLGPIFDTVAHNLYRDGKPEPHRRIDDHAAHFVFARNRAAETGDHEAPKSLIAELEGGPQSATKSGHTWNPAASAQDETAPARAPVDTTTSQQRARRWRHVVEPIRARLRRRPWMLALIAAAAVLATLAAFLWWPQAVTRPVTELRQVGETITWADRDTPRASTQIGSTGTIAVYAYLQDLYGPVHLHALDLQSGAELWHSQTMIETLRWELIVADDIIIIEYYLDGDNGQKTYYQRYFHLSDGSESTTVEGPTRINSTIGGYAITTDDQTGITVYDSDGEVQQAWAAEDMREDPNSIGSPAVELVGPYPDTGGASETENDVDFMWALTGNDYDHYDVSVFNLHSGKEFASGRLDLQGINSSAGIHAIAEGGYFMLGYESGGNFAINVFDINDDMSLIDSEVIDGFNYFTDCGDQSVCISSVETLRVYDLDAQDFVFEFTPEMPIDSLSAAGNLISLHYLDEDRDPYTYIYDPESNEVTDPVEGWFFPVDGDIAVAHTRWEDDYELLDAPAGAPEVPMQAFDQRTGKTTDLGNPQRLGIEFCHAGPVALACATTRGLTVYHYRDD